MLPKQNTGICEGASRVFLPPAFRESTPCLLGKEGASYSLHFVHTMVLKTQHLSVQIWGCKKHLVRQILKGQNIQLFVFHCTGQITSVSESSHMENTLPSFQGILWKNERARLTSKYKDEGGKEWRGSCGRNDFHGERWYKDGNHQGNWGKVTEEKAANVCGSIHLILTPNLGYNSIIISIHRQGNRRVENLLLCQVPKLTWC